MVPGDDPLRPRCRVPGTGARGGCRRRRPVRSARRRAAVRRRTAPGRRGRTAASRPRRPVAEWSASRRCGRRRSGPGPRVDGPALVAERGAASASRTARTSAGAEDMPGAYDTRSVKQAGLPVERGPTVVLRGRTPRRDEQSQPSGGLLVRQVRQAGGFHGRVEQYGELIPPAKFNLAWHSQRAGAPHRPGLASTCRACVAEIPPIAFRSFAATRRAEGSTHGSWRVSASNSRAPRPRRMPIPTRPRRRPGPWRSTPIWAQTNCRKSLTASPRPRRRWIGSTCAGRDRRVRNWRRQAIGTPRSVEPRAVDQTRVSAHSPRSGSTGRGIRAGIPEPVLGHFPKSRRLEPSTARLV